MFNLFLIAQIGEFCYLFSRNTFCTSNKVLKFKKFHLKVGTFIKCLLIKNVNMTLKIVCNFSKSIHCFKVIILHAIPALEWLSVCRGFSPVGKQNKAKQHPLLLSMCAGVEIWLWMAATRICTTSFLCTSGRYIRCGPEDIQLTFPGVVRN